MKKINGTTICYALSALLLLGFIIKTIIDYSKYCSTLNSAPFYIWIIMNVIYFIVPAIVAFTIGAVLKKKRQAA